MRAPAPPRGGRRAVSLASLGVGVVDARSGGAPPVEKVGAAALDYGRDQGQAAQVATVSKGVLKAKMLEYFRRVEESGEELVVTDNNVPVLRILPIRRRRPAAEVFADVRGRVRYGEDLLAPTTDEWSET